jgi:hypothetical protein
MTRGDSTIRWLHLTDLHVGMTQQRWLWPMMKARFCKNLTHLFVFFGSR